MAGDGADALQVPPAIPAVQWEALGEDTFGVLAHQVCHDTTAARRLITPVTLSRDAASDSEMRYR